MFREEPAVGAQWPHGFTAPAGRSRCGKAGCFRARRHGAAGRAPRSFRCRRDEADATRAHEIGSPLVVEWRALTVARLDKLGAMVRERLGLDAVSFPLAKLLEGGTWAAGRAIARERRADGAPPLRVISDGTVF